MRTMEWRWAAVVAAGVMACVGVGRGQTPAIDLFGALAVPRLTQAEFRVLHEAGAALVIDVRSAAAYDAGHIPGAIHMALDELDRRSAEVRLAASGRRVVTYCACPAEQTSIEAGRRLIRAGVPGVAALVGGFTRWVEGGGLVEGGG